MNLATHGGKTARFMVGMGCALALAACSAQEVESSGPQTISAQTPASGVVPGAAVRGGPLTSIAEQYAHPHPGGVSATGASAWVPPAPPPAYVGAAPVAETPAAAPPALANRQPSAPPAPAAAVNAADLVRPEAAAPDTPAPAAPARDPAVRTAGLKLFNSYSCSACHSLADAEASGSIGPSFDRNPRLTKDYALSILTNGQGAMPAFGGQMSDAEISTLADYIVQFSRK